MIKDFFLGDQAYPEIAFLKAFLYFHGYGLANDDRTAFSCCKTAAAAGLPSAQYLLGVMYLSGRGTVRSEARAIECFSEAAKLGHAAAAGAVSQLYAHKNDETSARISFEWALRAAKLGDADYMVTVALCLEEGTGTECDLKQAVAWYDKASSLGNPTAMRALARIYKQGLAGVRVDTERARELLTRAQENEELQQSVTFRFLRELALNGDRSAQRSLSDVYRNGWLGQAPNDARAAYWQARSTEVLIEP